MSRAVLIVRPQPGNGETAIRMATRGLAVETVPLFETHSVAWVAPEPKAYVGVLLTSANALRHAGPGLSRFLDLPAFAVGEVTARLAREAGFSSVVAGEGDVARLVAKVATLGLHRLLHLSGRDVRPFDPFGIEIDRVVTYAADPIAPPAAWLDILGQAPVILLHSPRASERVAELVPADFRPRIALVAISAAAAEAAGGGWEEVAIAAKPRDEAMLAEAVRLCA